MSETLTIARGLLQATSFNPRELGLENVVEWIRRVSEGSAVASDFPHGAWTTKARTLEARRAAAEIEAGVILALAICAARNQQPGPEDMIEVDGEAITLAQSSPPLPTAIVEFYRAMVSAQKIGSR